MSNYRLDWNRLTVVASRLALFVNLKLYVDNPEAMLRRFRRFLPKARYKPEDLGYILAW